ncbi:MAG: associated Golgi protein [Myxococcaceae bacterium]|nr:associated Golgi protein [Myxococcaceae bacterium]
MYRDGVQLIHDLLALLRDPGPIIQWGGYPALALIIFLETGAMVAFLPGDSLLFVAGVYASRGDLNILILVTLLSLMAVLGDATSYTIGSRVGPKIFNRPRSRFFKPEHVEAAHAFYEKHGGKAIVIARFVPLVRTFVPVIAGVAKMPYREFALFNIAGGISWVVSMTVGGYFLGSIFPDLGKHIEKVIIVIVVLSVLPMVFEYFKAKRRGKALAEEQTP